MQDKEKAQIIPLCIIEHFDVVLRRICRKNRTPFESPTVNLNEAIRTSLEVLKIVLFFVASFRHTSYCQKLPPRKDTDFQGLEVQGIFELANFR